MTEKPHKILLPREEARADVRKVFGPQLDLLEELVNYGSNLVPRVWESSNRSLGDMVIVHNFLKQAVTVMDGIEITASCGAVVDATILLRSLFELRIYLEWLFQADTENRGLLYYVWDTRGKLVAYKRLLPGTDENRQYADVMKNEPIASAPAEFTPDRLRELIARAEEKLASSELKETNARFEAWKKKRNGKGRPEWYSPEVNSVFEMAKMIGREGRYEIFFRTYSRFSHGLAWDSHITYQKEELGSNPIRTAIGLNGVFASVYMLADEIFEHTLKHYRADELTSFRQKYLREWRERKLALPIEKVFSDGRVVFTVPGVNPVPLFALDANRHLYVEK